MDNIDLDFATKKNIKIKTETSPSLAVAELTLAHILNLLRKSPLATIISKKVIGLNLWGCS